WEAGESRKENQRRQSYTCSLPLEAVHANHQHLLAYHGMAAIAHGDGRALERAAHSLKGTVMSFGAQTAGATALRLEVIGRSGDLTQAALVGAELEREVTQLWHALAVFKGEPVA